MESKIEIKEVGEEKPKGVMTPLYCGFEFEFNARSTTGANKIVGYIKDKFGLQYGEKTNGLKNKVVRQDGISITFSENRYEKSQFVSDFYRDGSVDYEVVTRPILTEKISILKEPVFDPIVESGDCWANGKGGLHITFLTDHHKDLSSFNPLWVRNLIQLSRTFYPALIMWHFDPDKRVTRPLGYRTIVSRGVVSSLGQSRHYDCISLRIDPDNNRIWGVEVRFPDGTNSWAVVENYVSFWRAMFNLAWDISQKGLIEFSQDIWDYNLKFYQDNQVRSSNIRIAKTNLKLILTKLLAPYMTENKVRTHYEGWLNWQNKCFAEKAKEGQ